MKKTVLSILLSLSLFSVLALNSCKEKSVEIPLNKSVVSDFSDMVFPSNNDILNEVLTGGTFDKEFSLIPFKTNTTSSNSKGNIIQCGDKSDDHDSDKEDEHHNDKDCDHHGDKEDDHDCDNENDHHGCEYGTILNQLNLTKEQKDLIYQYKQNYHTCVNDARSNYQTAKGNVLKSSNQQREDIIKQWKHGDFNRDHANVLLHNLEADTKQQIADLKAAFNATVSNCLCDFLKNIVLSLDPTQQVTFIAWVANNNCLNTVCDLSADINQM